MKAPDNFTILLVDDSIEELRFLVATLRRVGYKIVICKSGKDAITRIPVLQPDIILLDVCMPGMGGFALVRLLQQDPLLKSIPVIFLSAASASVNKLEGLKLGAVDYITKPANEEEVLLRIGIHLKSRTSSDTLSNFSHLENEMLPKADSTLSFEEQVINAISQLLEADYSKDIGCDAICKAVGLGRHRINDIYRERFGVTMMTWWREKKLQKAKEMLEKTQVSIQSISDDLGFSAASNFSNTFSERFGVSPREFRASSRVNS